MPTIPMGGPGGIVKRSLAMVLYPFERAIAKGSALDDVTHQISVRRNRF